MLIEIAELVSALVPLLVAVDAVGIVPMFLALTSGQSDSERRHTLRASLIAAAAVSVGFALVGKVVFLLLGITVGDFQIAGGLILLGLAALDLLGRDPRATAEPTDVGIVPLGVPLIAGPALITSTMVLVDLYGPITTVLALLATLALSGAVLAQASAVERLLGRNGARAGSKIVNLLLAAIAVHWIRQGLSG